MTEHRSYMTRFEGNLKFVCMMVAFLVLAVPFQLAQNRQDTVFDRQVANQKVITANTAAICRDRNIFNAKHNELVRLSIDGVVASTTMTPAAKTARVKLYTTTLIKLLPCPKGSS